MTSGYVRWADERVAPSIAWQRTEDSLWYRFPRRFCSGRAQVGGKYCDCGRPTRRPSSDGYQSQIASCRGWWRAGESGSSREQSRHSCHTLPTANCPDGIGSATGLFHCHRQNTPVISTKLDAVIAILSVVRAKL